MATINSYQIAVDHIPGETFLLSCLQKNLTFTINNRVVKKGKLLLFRRVHYFIQIALQSENKVRENFEIPIPFQTESYEDEGLLYFDYRPSSLRVASLPTTTNKISSTYYNKILEIIVQNQHIL
jgi:hypothetical protein